MCDLKLYIVVRDASSGSHRGAGGRRVVYHLGRRKKRRKERERERARLVLSSSNHLLLENNIGTWILERERESISLITSSLCDNA